MSNKEIASHLKIAEGTAKIHTAALLRTLGARNRTEAAFMASKLVSSIRAESRFKFERFIVKTRSVPIREWSEHAKAGNGSQPIAETRRQ
jgi:hypothetical protein